LEAESKRRKAAAPNCFKGYQAWYAELLLEMDLKILLRKTGARLNFKIALISLHIDPDQQNHNNEIFVSILCRKLTSIGPPHHDRVK
jgi:hypothetical protein